MTDNRHEERAAQTDRFLTIECWSDMVVDRSVDNTTKDGDDNETAWKQHWFELYDAELAMPTPGAGFLRHNLKWRKNLLQLSAIDVTTKECFH